MTPWPDAIRSSWQIERLVSTFDHDGNNEMHYWQAVRLKRADEPLPWDFPTTLDTCLTLVRDAGLLGETYRVKNLMTGQLVVVHGQQIDPSMQAQWGPARP